MGEPEHSLAHTPRQVRRRRAVGCTLIGFGSSAAIFAGAALLGSYLLAATGLMLALVTAADIWQILRC